MCGYVGVRWRQSEGRRRCSVVTCLSLHPHTNSLFRSCPCPILHTHARTHTHTHTPLTWLALNVGPLVKTAVELLPFAATAVVLSDDQRRPPPGIACAGAGPSRRAASAAVAARRRARRIDWGCLAAVFDEWVDGGGGRGEGLG